MSKFMKFPVLAFALCILASGLASRPVLAATRTASFSVTATVVSSCQVSAPATASGTYTATRPSPTSPVSVTCTRPTPYNVSYSDGPPPSVTKTTQKTAGSEAFHGTGSRSSRADTASGQSKGEKHDAPGADVDVVTVTVAY